MLTYLGHFPRFVGFISGSTRQYLSSALTGHIVGEPAGQSQPLAVMRLRSLDPTRCARLICKAESNETAAGGRADSYAVPYWKD